MSLLRMLTALAALAGASFAQIPDFYKKVDRLTWVVKGLDRPLDGWSKLGLSDVRRYGRLTLKGQYRGKDTAVSVRAATGQLGHLTVDMIEPAPGDNAFNEFLSRRGDGIFAIVHDVPTMDQVTEEIARMRSLGVGVLQQLSIETGEGTVSFTFFDTEPQGKYVLGLVHWPAGAPSHGKPGMISHLALCARDPKPISAFWEKLRFPALKISHASPRDDGRYFGKPLLLDFDVAWQSHSQFTLEWIFPPQNPPNFYADFLKRHGEGVQHFGLPIDDLEVTVAQYKNQGYQPGQAGAWGDVGNKNSGRYDYMDTDAIGGVIAEVIKEYK